MPHIQTSKGGYVIHCAHPCINIQLCVFVSVCICTHIRERTSGSFHPGGGEAAAASSNCMPSTLFSFSPRNMLLANCDIMFLKPPECLLGDCGSTARVRDACPYLVGSLRLRTSVTSNSLPPRAKTMRTLVPGGPRMMPLTSSTELPARRPSTVRSTSPAMMRPSRKAGPCSRTCVCVCVCYVCARDVVMFMGVFGET